MISEFDARQLRKMKLQLAAFQDGELSLAGLIGDVDFLLNAMEAIPTEWKQRVHEFVITLEEVYAVALDLGHTEVDEQGQRFVAEAIEGIQNGVRHDYSMLYHVTAHGNHCEVF